MCQTAAAEVKAASKHIPRLVCGGKRSLVLELSDNWQTQMGKFLFCFVLIKEENITAWIGQ